MSQSSTKTSQQSVLAMVAERARKRRQGIAVGGLEIPVVESAPMPAKPAVETAQQVRFEDEKGIDTTVPRRTKPGAGPVVENVDLGKPAKLPEKIAELPAIPDEVVHVAEPQRQQFLKDLELELNGDARAWDWAIKFMSEKELNDWEDQDFAIDVRRFLMEYFSEGDGARFNRDPYMVWSRDKLKKTVKYGESM